MLLVDHDRAERPEVDPLLDERVGADGDVDLARRQAGQDAPAVRGPHLVRQQLDPHRSGAEQRGAVVGDLDAVEERLLGGDA